MKRLVSLTLALLMTLVLFGAAGARTYAHAEDAASDNPFLGLWEFTGMQEGDVYISAADAEQTVYFDFLPSGAIYGVNIQGGRIDDTYWAYVVTGENTLDLYEDDDPAPSVYDPETGVLAMTSPDGSMTVFFQRIVSDPLPDIRALVDHSQEERTYYGYRMSQGDMTMNLLEFLPTMDLEPEDIYLTMNPDGTGYMQFGTDDAGGEITWTDTEIVAEGNAVSYTRAGDHILIAIEDLYTVEFAPEGEIEALMVLMEATKVEQAPVDVTEEDLVGTWTLAKAGAAGVILTPDQLKQQGVDVDMAFQFNADGTAAMIQGSNTTNGLEWKLDGTSLILSMHSYDLFTFTFDGTYLVLTMGADLYFEKAA